MRVIIAGSRDLTGPEHVAQAVEASGFQVSQVVCGAARGVDQLGARWAEARSIPVVYFRAKWEQFGRSAGMLRNLEMTKNADALVAIWDGKSPGTRHIISAAKSVGLKVHVHIVRVPEEQGVLL